MKKFSQVTVFFVFLMALGTLWSAPEKRLWPRWQEHEQESTQVIDHRAYQGFLNRYVFLSEAGFNQVHYSKVTREDKTRLDKYIKYLSSIDIDLYNRQEQLAFWINLYNALTIQLILDHWPVSSIVKLNISPGWFSFGPWDAKLVTVEGVPLTLNDIEHRIIRPIWNDSRTHYALNCASYSCPQIQAEPFTAIHLDAMLDKAASDYINSSRGVDNQADVLQLSSIYQWYAVDFAETRKEVLKQIAAYAKPSLQKNLLANTKPIKYDYHWQINGN